MPQTGAVTMISVATCRTHPASSNDGALECTTTEADINVAAVISCFILFSVTWVTCGSQYYLTWQQSDLNSAGLQNRLQSTQHQTQLLTVLHAHTSVARRIAYAGQQTKHTNDT